jgi:arabinofuranosyltransferase
MEKQKMKLNLSRKEKWVLAMLLPVTAIALFLGWRLFWFLADDAYISFRYASNLVAGHGLVWNPEPFRPVEGYSNFLWVILLAQIWRWTGLEPPAIANVLALCFSFLSLLLFARFLLTMKWRAELIRFRIPFLVLALLGILSNRTFLAWTSSGLETAMYNFLVLLWLFCLLRIPPESGSWFLCSTLAAALLELTRPDGMLFLAGTVVIGLLVARRQAGPSRLQHILWLAIASSPAACHLLWRKLYYGEWLPNTYYAKIDKPWPESGWRYLLSFVLEYALWIFLLAAAVILFRRRRRQPNPAGRPPLLPWAAAGLLGAQFLYYTFIAGGDHFEYRVYSHLFFLLFIGWIWLLNRSRLKPGSAAALLLVSIVCSWPVPWTHWRLSQPLTTREETYMMRLPIARTWPGLLRWYARGFDRLQGWLIPHFVCMRHQEHKVLPLWMQRDHLPPRSEGARYSSPGYPVMVVGGGIGIMGWVLPGINLIDLYGLNDYVIARTPAPSGQMRRMAHGRAPANGYLEGFRPNARVMPGKWIRIARRERELTAAEIRQYETFWWNRIRNR